MLRHEVLQHSAELRQPHLAVLPVQGIEAMAHRNLQYALPGSTTSCSSLLSIVSTPCECPVGDVRGDVSGDRPWLVTGRGPCSTAQRGEVNEASLGWAVGLRWCGPIQ